MATEQFANNATTTLSGGIDNVTTSIPVVSATGFPTSAQYRIRIDNELMLVTAGAGTGTWTATRGVEGTAAAAHLSAAGVKHVLTAGALAAAFPISTTMQASYQGTPGATVFYTSKDLTGATLVARTTTGVTEPLAGFFLYSQPIGVLTAFIAIWDENDINNQAAEVVVVSKL